MAGKKMPFPPLFLMDYFVSVVDADLGGCARVDNETTQPDDLSVTTE